MAHIRDAATADHVRGRALQWSELCCEQVGKDGSVAAYNTGLARASQDIVAFIDDDATPEADWIERIEQTFAQDERIGGVGGRDVIDRPGREHGVRDVGRLQWFGRAVANHHLGTGPPRDVDILKGVNMAFRRATVVDHGFDPRLRGPGAQVHAELSICLPLRRSGMRIVYDPSLVVRHSPAARPAGDHRRLFNRDVVAAAAFNEALPILDYFGRSRRAVFYLWGLVFGTTDCPGLVVTGRDLVRGRPASLARFLAAQRGRLAAWRMRNQTRPRGPGQGRRLTPS